MVHRAARTNVNPLLEAKQKSPVFGGREFARLSFSVVGGGKVYFSHFLGGFILSCWRCLLWSSLEHKLLLLCRPASCPTLLHWWKQKWNLFFQIQKPKSRSKFLRKKVKVKSTANRAQLSRWMIFFGRFAILCISLRLRLGSPAWYWRCCLCKLEPAKRCFETGSVCS